MCQEVSPTTLSCKTEVVHRTTLCGFLGSGTEIDQLVLLRSAILYSIALDQLQVALPLASNGKVTGIAANRNREVHYECLLLS